MDFYAIEDSSYNGYLMGEVQDMGKEMYVWTINEEDKIIKYLQSPVDGMIRTILRMCLSFDRICWRIEAITVCMSAWRG